MVDFDGLAKGENTAEVEGTQRGWKIVIAATLVNDNYSSLAAE